MHYIVSPYRKIKYGGKMVSSVKFKTLMGARKFTREKKLKKAMLYLVRKKR
jgi:hypothetical protein